MTGGTGMVGAEIVQRLVSRGYAVRVLSRSPAVPADRVEFVRGGLDDDDALRRFVSGVTTVFHCAAELRHASRMWSVNVEGTARLVALLKTNPVRTFCFLSSAGVVGLTGSTWVTEDMPCNPQTPYERTKWAAERLVAEAEIPGCHTIILRPTDVIDDRRPGALGLPMRGTWRDRLHVFVKGAECAHVVHACDVAEAAVFLMDRGVSGVERYFVSCDDDPMNTFAGLWSLYAGLKRNVSEDSLRPVIHVPVIVPHLLRRAVRGPANPGDVRYSTDKLRAEGFRCPVGVAGSVRRLLDRQGSWPLREGTRR